ncbi:contactin-1-like [Dreissena polymorpha]|nr:contactin-1-like [Dreissena polymorpha]
MDNRLTYSWIILSVLISTKGTIRISSYIVAHNKFNITCQWTGLATDVIFYRQTQTLAYPSAGGEHSRVDNVLQVTDPENECHIQSSLIVACVCIKYSAVSCIINNTLEEQLIVQWKCAIYINGDRIFSNITSLKTYEPAKITTFQVDAFQGVSHVTLKENNTAMLTCISEGFPIPEISLKRDTLAFGASIVQSEISIRGQLNKTFTNVSRQMTGKYTCVASNEHGQSEQSLYLNILYPPSVIRTDNVYINEGEGLNITCKYEPGNPPETAVHWKKEGIIYSNKTLLYPRVARTDAGNYSCIATNTYDNGHTNFTGVDSQRFILHVLFPVSRKIPVTDFSNYGNEANIYLGGEVTFSFSALANPLPTSAEYVWHKCSDTNCTEIANSSRSYIETYRDFSNLTVVNITESDYGMYILQVGNGIGKPHTEVYFLKRLSSLPTKPMTNMTVIGLLAGLSGALILVIIFVLAEYVHRHLTRTETIDVGCQSVVPTTSYNDDTTVKLPFVPLDRLDVQGEAIALYSSAAQLEIYSQIDLQLVEEMISRNDGSTNETQLVTEPIRCNGVGPPEPDDEPQYIVGRCGR